MAEPAGTPEPAPARPPRHGDDVVTPVGPPGLGTVIAYRTVRLFVLTVAKLLGRVHVIGADKVPADRPFVLAPVHRSNVDFALTSLVTRRRMRYMGKDSIWKSRLLGRFVTMLGAFPVHRGTADREAIRLCSEIIEGGEPLVMFPEGTRQSGPVVEDLFDGPAYVAAKGQVPIVPMGIGGSEAMMPKGAKYLHPSKLVLIVGDPIEPPAPTGTGRVSRSGVTDLTRQLGAEVQALFDEAQSLAGRPNPPR
jgi:1-acyl-sn-glycerol-3-phosphate acyltransferase